MRHPIWLSAVALAVTGLVAAGCSSSSSTGSGTPTSGSSPAAAARCANQLVAKHPIAILGAADVGAPASIPIYQHANLAYLGGIPFTPVPMTAPNSIQFWSVSVGDNAAAAVYAGKTLGVKS